MKYNTYYRQVNHFDVLHLSRWDFFFIERFVSLYVAWHTKKIWAFSDLVAAIFAALHENFVRSKYANSVSQFLLYWMRIICCIYKDFVRQLKAFLPSFCHLCACEMSPGWGHLITWTDPSVGHLNGILARVGGNLNNNFRKSQMPGGLPGGACWSFDLTDTLQIQNCAVQDIYQRTIRVVCSFI